LPHFPVLPESRRAGVPAQKAGLPYLNLKPYSGINSLLCVPNLGTAKYCHLRSNYTSKAEKCQPFPRCGRIRGLEKYFRYFYRVGTHLAPGKTDEQMSV